MLNRGGPWLVWTGTVAAVAAGTVIAAPWYALIAAMLVAIVAAATQRRLVIRQRRTAAHLSDTILALRRHAETFEADATTDRLTGLANRQAFYRALEDTALRCRQPLRDADRQAGLLIIDLNFFKTINDTWGHHVGDQALKQLARVLRQETRAEDVTGRLGGDEFAVLAPGADPAMTHRLAERIIAAAEARPIHRDTAGRAVRLSLSIGTAALADHPDSDSALIAADRELYAVKERFHADQAVDAGRRGVA